MKKLIFAAATVASVLSVAPAQALIVAIEPDFYAVGTNVSHIQEGLTISQLTWPSGSPGGSPLPPTRSDVFVADCASTPAGCFTGTRDFGFTFGGDGYEDCVSGSFLCQSTIRVLEFAFDAPVDYFQLTSTWLSDPPLAWAYDFAGNRVDLCGGFGSSPCLTFTHSPDGGRSTLWFDHALRDISRVVVGGTFGNSRIDQVLYNVPEPSTLALFAAGLAVVVFRRRLVPGR